VKLTFHARFCSRVREVTFWLRHPAIDTNALASSIVLVCRPRPETAPSTTRRQFVTALKRELPDALQKLQQGNIASVDLAQASIGPGMAIYSRYSKVLESDGTPMPVRTALQLINQMLDEYLAEQESEFDAETKFALIWFEQYTFKDGLFGEAETLSKAKNTSVQGMVEAGVLLAKAGKVRLLRRNELPKDWNPQTDKRLTVWEATQYMIRALLDEGGETSAAALLSQLGTIGEAARELAYRLYNICDRQGWASEGVAYNSLVMSWSEISRLAADVSEQTSVQMSLI
jgi:putative DNA methylase